MRTLLFLVLVGLVWFAEEPRESCRSNSLLGFEQSIAGPIRVPYRPPVRPPGRRPRFRRRFRR